MGGFEVPVEELKQQSEDTDGFVSFDQLNLTYNKSVALRAIGSMRKPKLGFGRLRPVLSLSKSRNASIESFEAKPDLDMISTLPSISSQHVRCSSESASRQLLPMEQRRPSAVSDDVIKHSPLPSSPTAETTKAAKKLSKDASSRRVPSMGPMQTESKPLPLAVDVDNKKMSRTHIAELLAVKPLPDPHATLGPEVYAHRTPRISSLTPWTEPKISTTTVAHNRQVSGSSVESDLHSASTDRSSQSREESWPTSQSTSPPDTPTTSMYPSLRVSAYNNVELTLTSTINELKQLQGDWCPEEEDVTPDAQQWSSQEPVKQSYDQHDWAYSASGYFKPSTTETSRGNSMPQLLPAKTFVPSSQSKDSNVQQQPNKVADVLSLDHGSTEDRLAAMAAQLKCLKAQNADLSRSAMEAEQNLQAVLARMNNGISGHKTAELEADLTDEKKESSNLQAKFNESNVQKLELLERQYELRNDASRSLSSDTPLTNPNQQVDDLKRNLNKLVKKNIALKQQLDMVASSSPGEMLQAKIADLRTELADRDIIISQLRESQHKNTKRTMVAETETQQKSVELETLRSRVQALKERLDGPSAPSSSAASINTIVPTATAQAEDCGIASLKSQLHTSQKDLQRIRKEREQLASLLHSEIRRTAIEEHNRCHPNANFLKLRPDYESSIEQARQRARKHVLEAMAAISSGKAEAECEANEKANSCTAGCASGLPATLNGTCANRTMDEEALLRDKEIEYYLQDIILYKLDVKGYKKDLKRLRAERERSRECRTKTCSSSPTAATS